MASTFRLDSHQYDGRYMYVSCTQVKDIATNTSTINWTLTVTGGSVNNYTTGPTTVTINGTQVYYAERKSWSTYEFPAVKGSVSGSLKVAHDTQGELTVPVSITTNIYTGVMKTASGNWTLDSIPRQATITSAPTTFSDEASSVTITYSNPAGTAVDKVEACIADSKGQAIFVQYEEISRTGTSYTFVFTDAEKQELRSAATGNTLDLRYYLRTTIGGVSYWDYKPCTMTIGNASPIVTASVVDTNATTIALTGDENILVKYFSNAKATMTAEAQKGATLDTDSYVITNGRSVEYGTEGLFMIVEDNTFTFAVTDSRGNTGRTTVTPTMVEYIPLTCNLGNDKPDGDGKMVVACSGMYFNGSFGKESNTLSVKFRYKSQGGSFSAWQSMDVEFSGNSYLASASVTGLDYKTAYVVECEAEDRLTATDSSSGLLKSLPIFHWGENDFVFEVPVTFNGGIDGLTFDGDLDVTGDLRLKGDGNYGNTLRFGDDDYCYISEPTDDDMLIHADKITLDAPNGVFLGGYAIPIVRYGTWSPYLNSAVVSSYTTQYGWYSKVNQAVTVGFFIKATCRSGYENTVISISGLPFTPMFSAAGGGMCSGAYVSGGFTFQCFVAETSGSITTRVQSCNHTSQTNLSTSSTGCWYRSGGGELTLSGTITYMSNS